jgi:hypothetical protein
MLQLYKNLTNKFEWSRQYDHPTEKQILEMIRFPLNRGTDMPIITPPNNKKYPVLPERYELVTAGKQDYKTTFYQMITERILELGELIQERSADIKDTFESYCSDYYDIEEAQTMSDDFFRHLEASGDLILAGPPQANEHYIDPVRAEKWVNSFPLEEQEIARNLVKNIRYISHQELIVELKNCMLQIIKTIDDTKTIWLCTSNSTNKSDYYISLLFAKIWEEEGYPAISFACSYPVIPFDCYIINVDDMMYSGSQTIDSYMDYTKTLIDPIIEKVFQKVVPELCLANGTINLTSSFFREFVFDLLGCHHYIVRPFCSRDALTEYKKCSKYFIPHVFICTEVIDNLKYLVGDDIEKYPDIFLLPDNITQSTAVYFDHKVADLGSTVLNAIGYGAVPSKCFIRFISGYPETMPSDESLIGDYRETYDGEKVIKSHPEISETRRCPYAWYKKIDYETGTYVEE